MESWAHCYVPVVLAVPEGQSRKVTEVQEFKASLGNIVRSYLLKKGGN